MSRDPKSIAAVTHVPSSPPPPPCRPLSLLTRQPPPPQGPPPCTPLPVNSLASSPSWPTALIPLAVSTLTTPKSPRKGPPARAGQRSTEQRKRGGSHQMQQACLTANPSPVSCKRTPTGFWHTVPRFTPPGAVSPTRLHTRSLHLSPTDAGLHSPSGWLPAGPPVPHLPELLHGARPVGPSARHPRVAPDTSLRTHSSVCACWDRRSSTQKPVPP